MADWNLVNCYRFWVGNHHHAVQVPQAWKGRKGIRLNQRKMDRNKKKKCPSGCRIKREMKEPLLRRWEAEGDFRVKEWGLGEGRERSWGEYYFLSYMNRQHISLEHSKSSWPRQPPSLRVPQSSHLCISLLLDSASVFTTHTASFPVLFLFSFSLIPIELISNR